ncbi:hypothetical protein KP77_25540 [Jeotgalibacillus alimentarius]|uniref:Uncharacterized protein n=1 Tax=Jeotgalibacillus alimentarius TaxID=135826 RepID=A0A0C2VBV4_9BACL|nr:hypothetical protein [Jeotgalibacillus alimentarius]KIL46427.1 hypothetical protein KP77_25540 [Jeotgalibacillus alimentarius]
MKNLFKSKKFLSALVLLGIFLLGTGVGNGYATVPLDDVKFNYDEAQNEVLTKQEAIEDLEAELEAKQKEIESAESKHDSVLKNIEDDQEKYDTAMTLYEDRETLSKEVKELTDNLESKQSQVAGLDETIDTKKAELSTVNERIKAAEGGPIELPAGKFVVGKDLPVGRYKVEPIGRGSNFATYDNEGYLDVNIILSADSSIGVSEYVTYMLADYLIESDTPAIYTPVQ